MNWNIKTVGNGKALQLRLSIAFLASVFLLLTAGCEPKAIEFKIVSQNGETNFSVPAEMIDKCCRPKKEANIVMVDLDAKKNGGNGYYYVTLLANGNNNSLVTKTLPDRVTSAEETPSEIPGYRKYIQHKDPHMPFLLVGVDNSGYPIYLQCVALFSEHKKCTYYGIYNEKIAYEFMFPSNQIGEINNLINYSINKISPLIVKE